MKTFEVLSRYGTKYKAVLVDENTIHFFANEASYVSAGATEDNNPHAFGFIDPEGGPFIALFETPSFCIHKDLPNREIVEITFDTDHYVSSLKKRRRRLRRLLRTLLSVSLRWEQQSF